MRVSQYADGLESVDSELARLCGSPIDKDNVACVRFVTAIERMTRDQRPYAQKVPQSLLTGKRIKDGATMMFRECASRHLVLSCTFHNHSGRPLELKVLHATDDQIDFASAVHTAIDRHNRS